MSRKTYLNSSWLLWGGVGSEAGTSTVLGPWAIALANKSSCGLKGNWNCFGPRALVTESRKAQHNETSGQLFQWQTCCLLGVGGAWWWHHSQTLGSSTNCNRSGLTSVFTKNLQILSKQGLKGFWVCLLPLWEDVCLLQKTHKSTKKSTIL